MIDRSQSNEYAFTWQVMHEDTINNLYGWLLDIDNGRVLFSLVVEEDRPLWNGERAIVTTPGWPELLESGIHTWTVRASCGSGEFSSHNPILERRTVVLK
jgi:hypothetical protein